jgi:hypothetical protein
VLVGVPYKRLRGSDRLQVQSSTEFNVGQGCHEIIEESSEIVP